MKRRSPGELAEAVALTAVKLVSISEPDSPDCGVGGKTALDISGEKKL